MSNIWSLGKLWKEQEGQRRNMAMKVGDNISEYDDDAIMQGIIMIMMVYIMNLSTV